MAGKGLGAILLAMCCLLLWPLGAKAQEFVPRVAQVEAVVGDSHQLPLPVKQRMEKSVQAIGVQLLEGMKVEELKAQETHYAEIIQQVFDKVLIGYTVDRVHIYPGANTKVQVDLIPWQDKICQVKVHVQVEGMSPVLSDMLYQDVAGIDEIFKQSLQGLPIAAVDWTQGLLKQQVNAFLQQHAPEFKADFDVVVSENTQINLVLYPLLPVVRTVDLSMHSDTLLNAGLLLRRQAMQNRVNELIGLPVSFVERHQGELENYLANVLNEDSLSHSWDVHTKAAITPGQQLTVMSRSDSDTYRVRLEGWADMGNEWGNQEDTSIMARLHLGRMLSSRDEIFTRLDFYPQAVRCDWNLGYGYHLPGGTGLAGVYDLRHNNVGFELFQPLGGKWQLRYAYRSRDQENEYGLRYRLHDFLTVEYAMDRHNGWLRFIGYF